MGLGGFELKMILIRWSNVRFITTLERSPMSNKANQVQSRILEAQRRVEYINRQVVDSEGDDMSHYQDLLDDLCSAEKELSTLLTDFRFFTKEERFHL